MTLNALYRKIIKFTQHKSYDVLDNEVFVIKGKDLPGIRDELFMVLTAIDNLREISKK